MNTERMVFLVVFISVVFAFGYVMGREDGRAKWDD